MSMSWIMSYENIPQNLSDVLLSISDNKCRHPHHHQLIAAFCWNIYGYDPCGIDFYTDFSPVVKFLSIDPIQFGIIMVLNLCMGLCTPPVGSVLFVGIGIAKTSIERVIKPLLPLFIAMIIALLLITFFPQITLWLPHKFGF